VRELLARKPRSRQGRARRSPVAGDIEFKDVSFATTRTRSCRGELPGEAGQVAAFVGETGRQEHGPAASGAAL